MKQVKLLQIISGLVFAGTVFLGAFLLFQVQPLIGRFLLPWFGGTPEVWTTCMLFFQVFLLGGYAYAHGLVQLSNPKLAAMIHIALLAAALLFLPIIPDEALKPTGQGNPVLGILLICAATVGLPYLLLSATSPLVQVWYSRSFGGRSPYRLYALSNAGSLLALASFPFVFEPLMTRIQTGRLWSAAFAVFAVVCAAGALLGKNRPAETEIIETDANRKPTAMRILLWIALPMAASVELLAVTNKITQDIAVVPFLWVLPLVLYLLSFIICFDHQRWYRRWLWVPLYILGIAGVIWVRFSESQGAGVVTLIAVHVLMLFTCCMVCHGELYRLRPSPKHLTVYFLMIAAGGALGGIFVAVICPLIFKVYIELYLGLLASALFLLLAEDIGHHATRSSSAVLRRRVLTGLLFIVGTLGIVFMGKRSTNKQVAIENRRNFFGVLTIYEDFPDEPDMYQRLMQHGTTFHGLQFQSPEKKLLPTAYYSPDSGIGIVMKHFPKTDHRCIGIVGLGVGTIATYGQKGDVVRFYEINPEVERLAREYFTYLDDTDAEVEVVLGDARLTMEREEPQGYDVLVVDAFSSDAVPVHLLTVEAMEIYLNHLDENGVLAFHISTMHLDLHSVVFKLAEKEELAAVWIEEFEKTDTGTLASDWILLSRNRTFLDSKAIKEKAGSPKARRKDVTLWTDDHINLLEILKKSPSSY